MNPSLPIGVFDSGLGGLTIVKAIQELLPQENLIYYGDTAHLPYGDKSPELIKGYSSKIASFLLEQPVKAIVIACNTASAVASLDVAALAGDVPVLDVISPAVKEAERKSRNLRIGVIGTKTTIHSGVYGTQLEWAAPSSIVVEKATPLLVPMIEEGWLHNRVSQDVIDAYMSDTGFKEIDTLILGCTHYPLVKNQIEHYFRQNYDHQIHVIDSSRAVAREVQKELSEKGMLRREEEEANYSYYLSDFAPDFQSAAKIFLERDVTFNKQALA